MVHQSITGPHYESQDPLGVFEGTEGSDVIQGSSAYFPPLKIYCSINPLNHFTLMKFHA